MKVAAGVFTIVGTFVLLFAANASVAQTAGADLKGSADQNPVVWSDMPDTCVIRVGDTYWTTTTTMHFCPQVPVLKSKDLVNWKIASYCAPILEDGPEERLDNGKHEYMHGTWASSIRHHKGKFIVSTFNLRTKTTYVFETDNPDEGNWRRHSFKPLIFDHSIWFEDGKVYMVGQGTDIRIREIKPDFSGVMPGGVDKLLVKNVQRLVPNGWLGEGTQVLKHNGWYYLVNITWGHGDCRTVTVHRSRNLTGPYDEGRVVYRCEGIAQGTFVETPEGKWYGSFFGDRGAVGRIPYIIPMTWSSDGWPVIGGDGKSRPNLAIPGVKKDLIPGFCVSDEFDSAKMKLEWQFNHNPANALWSLTERPGWYRIKTDRVDAELFQARNTLVQRTFGPHCEAEVKLDFSALKPGDVAGMALFQREFCALQVEKTDDGANIVMTNFKGERHVTPISGTQVYIKGQCDYSVVKSPYDHRDEAQWWWSKDGRKWNKLGGVQKLRFLIDHFTGYRYALFMYSTKNPGGHADFDYYRIRRPEKREF